MEEKREREKKRKFETRKKKPPPISLAIPSNKDQALSVHPMTVRDRTLVLT